MRAKTLMFLSLFAACGDDGNVTPPNEQISAVMLSFAPSAGGAAVNAEWNDPDGEGGAAPTIQPVNLTAATYTLAVRFQNRLGTIPEEITDEVRDEDEDHLVLFTGSATTAALTITYADMDANGLPVGLTTNVVAAAGMGQLTLTLRHMPPEEPPVKSATTVMDAKTNGIETIGGSTDASVNFDVTVQ